MATFIERTYLLPCHPVKRLELVRPRFDSGSPIPIGYHTVPLYSASSASEDHMLFTYSVSVSAPPFGEIGLTVGHPYESGGIWRCGLDVVHDTIPHECVIGECMTFNDVFSSQYDDYITGDIALIKFAETCCRRQNVIEIGGVEHPLELFRGRNRKGDAVFVKDRCGTIQHGFIREPDFFRREPVLLETPRQGVDPRREQSSNVTYTSLRHTLLISKDGKAITGERDSGSLVLSYREDPLRRRNVIFIHGMVIGIWEYPGGSATVASQLPEVLDSTDIVREYKCITNASAYAFPLRLNVHDNAKVSSTKSNVDSGIDSAGVS